jgi:hypothetical protein
MAPWRRLRVRAGFPARGVLRLVSSNVAFGPDGPGVRSLGDASPVAELKLPTKGSGHRVDRFAQCRLFPRAVHCHNVHPAANCAPAPGSDRGRLVRRKPGLGRGRSATLQRMGLPKRITFPSGSVTEPSYLP